MKQVNAQKFKFDHSFINHKGDKIYVFENKEDDTFAFLFYENEEVEGVILTNYYEKVSDFRDLNEEEKEIFTTIFKKNLNH